MHSRREPTVTQESAPSHVGTAAGQSPLRVLVITVVHDPDDARIRYRQLSALLELGATVTYAAPFTAYRRPPPAGVTAIDLPRALGRHRLTAIREARRLLHREGPKHDIALLHDPELLLTVPGMNARHQPLVVWDVHEDTAAALTMKSWLPHWLRPLAAAAIRASERWAERHCSLLLAEESYRNRFRRPHPVVPNSVIVPADAPPPAGTRRVVYLGRLTEPRGALEMIELGRRLAPEITVELIGPADSDVAKPIADAHRRGWVHHHGFVPNREALGLLRGALAGLALLHDEPNYATSRPTKVMEYMAFGVPVVTTPNAASAELVRHYQSGLVVPFASPEAAVEAVRSLRADPQLRHRLGEAGRAGAVRDLDWREDGRRFSELLSAWGLAAR
jgi:glycosyltransferase involved in cell wall biosynthesis